MSLSEHRRDNDEIQIWYQEVFGKAKAPNSIDRKYDRASNTLGEYYADFWDHCPWM